jgi:hypothetical protein
VFDEVSHDRGVGHGLFIGEAVGLCVLVEVRVASGGHWWCGGWCVVDASWGKGSGNAVCCRLGRGNWVLDHSGNDGSFSLRGVSCSVISRTVEFTEGA